MIFIKSLFRFSTDDVNLRTFQQLKHTRMEHLSGSSRHLVRTLLSSTCKTQPFAGSCFVNI